MKKIINAPGDNPTKLYSMAVIAEGKFLFLSGCCPLDLDTYKIKQGTFEEQVRLTLDNLEVQLKNADLHFTNVVSIRIYINNLTAEKFEILNKVYPEYFTKERPTRTTIGVTLLGFDIEIDCIACYER